MTSEFTRRLGGDWRDRAPTVDAEEWDDDAREDWRGRALRVPVYGVPVPWPVIGEESQP